MEQSRAINELLQDLTVEQNCRHITLTGGEYTVAGREDVVVAEATAAS